MKGAGSKLVREAVFAYGVYTMTVNDKVKYVGKTEQGFRRFRGYRDPKPEAYEERQKKALVSEELKKATP